MPKILIVEDETIVALDIKSALKKLNYEVTDCVTNYDDAISSVKNNRPDIILLDIHLDKSKDGIEIAEEILKTQDISIIYLSAFCDDITIQRAVKTNPVSYLIKPFKREELKSNISLAIHKNAKNIDKNLKDLGNDYFYDLEKKELYHLDILIKLSKNEKLLLSFIILSRGNIISFEELEDNIWPEYSVSSSTLRTLIYRLRSKLAYKIIESIQGEGCKLMKN